MFSKDLGGGGRGGQTCVKVRVLTRLSCHFRHLLSLICLNKGLQSRVSRAQTPPPPPGSTPLSTIKQTLSFVPMNLHECCPHWVKTLYKKRNA